MNMKSILSQSFLGVLLVSVLMTTGCGKKQEEVSQAAPEVLVSQVVERDVPIYREFVGQTQGYQDVEIRARVEGYLQTVNFKEGSFVKKGDLLYQIDPKPFEVALEQAKGDLAQAKAKLGKAQIDVDRFKPLVEQQALSRQELDTAMAAFDGAKAAVDSAQAAVNQAELNLGYTRITAPIDGLIDVSKVKPGNLVGRGENTLLTIISRIDPVLVRVSINEKDYLIFARAEKNKEVSEEDKQKYSRVDLVLADNSIHDYPGKVEYEERAVDSRTGTLTIALAFPNPKNFLRPGQYGKVRAVTDLKKNAILVPQRAVRELQGTYSVAVVGAENKVSFRNVKAGYRDGQEWVIEEGLKPGEKVVVEGLHRVREGMPVSPKMIANETKKTPAA